jgi:hypothetical protein
MGEVWCLNWYHGLDIMVMFDLVSGVSSSSVSHSSLFTFLVDKGLSWLYLYPLVSRTSLYLHTLLSLLYIIRTYYW